MSKEKGPDAMGPDDAGPDGAGLDDLGTEDLTAVLSALGDDGSDGAGTGEAFGLEDAGDDAEPAPLPASPRGTAELARVEAALLARAGETLIEKRLDATRRACELLGDVHASAPVITVTGTNGKTSTVRMVDAVLGAHGLRVGRFTSPHLHRVTERISIDSDEVDESVFVRVYYEIEPVLQLVDAELVAEGRGRLTYFEALTVLAFAVFADAPVEVIVLEVGLGGEWDSTNVADALVCGFAPIGMDHMAQLGDDLTAIAATKAGILDRSIDPSPAPQPMAVFGEQDPEAAEELAAQLERRQVTGAWAGTHFGIVTREKAVDGQLLTLQGLYGVYPDVFLPLHGEHQARNASLALGLVEAFLSDGEKQLDPGTVAEGFAQVTSPGRAEILRAEPTIVVDGAHNPAGARVLADTIEEAFDFSDVVAVVAMYADKDPHGVLEHVHRFASRIIVTASLSPRTMSREDLRDAAVEWYDPDDVIDASDVNDALMRAIDLALDDGEPSVGIVVTGSLSTVAEARTLLGRKGEQ